MMDLNYSNLPFTVYKINPISYDDIIYQNMNIHSSKNYQSEDFESFSNAKLKSISKERKKENITFIPNNLQEEGNNILINEKLNRSFNHSIVKNKKESPSSSDQPKESSFFQSFEKEKINKISFQITSLSNDKKLKSNYKLIKDLNPSYDNILGILAKGNESKIRGIEHKEYKNELQKTKNEIHSKKIPDYSNYKKNHRIFPKGNAKTNQNWHNINVPKDSNDRINEIIKNLSEKNKNALRVEYLNNFLHLNSYNNSNKNKPNSMKLNSLPQIKSFAKKSLYKSLLNKTVMENKNLHLFTSKDASNFEPYPCVECPFHHLRNKSYNKWDNIWKENCYEHNKRLFSSQFNYKKSDKHKENLRVSTTESYLFELVSNFKQMSQMEKSDLNFDNIDEIINLKKVDQINVCSDTIKLFYEESITWSQELSNRIFNYLSKLSRSCSNQQPALFKFSRFCKI